MLDEQNGGAIAADVFEETFQRLGFGRVHACRGFVERQQFWLGRERARDLEAALVAVRKVLSEIVGAFGDSDVVEQLVGASLDRRLLGKRPLVAEDGAEHAGFRAHVAPDHHVLQRGQVLE